MRIVISVLSVSLLAGCAASLPPPGAAEARFDAREAAFIHRKGPSTLRGQAFLKRTTGTVVYSAGETIRLIPATAYAKARMNRLYGGRKFVPAQSVPKVTPDPDYARHTRSTVADPQGRFIFENVAPGAYFITAQAVWKEQGRYLPSGGVMYQNVTISGREERPVDVIVSGN